MKKIIIIIYSCIMFCLIILFFYPIIENSDFVKSKGKDYIFVHNEKFHTIGYQPMVHDSVLNIDIANNYYTDVTFRLTSDSSYIVIFWGDRESCMWNIRKDFMFSVDIPYNRSKGKDVTRDIQLINCYKFGQINSYKKL